MTDQVMLDELLKMNDIDSIIASILPNMSLGDSNEVMQLQTWLNLKYGDDLLIDGDYGTKTSAALNTWLGTYNKIDELGRGASNTLINPERARTEGQSMGFTPFNDMQIAENVNSAAMNARGTSNTIDSVINELSIDNLGDADENA
tara:strand:+ start:3228 stop:3665 length:438 start_codon:yes stop_codon:yes gene_type:complete